MKNLTWQNPEQLFVAQELINKVKSKCCGIKDEKILSNFLLLRYLKSYIYNSVAELRIEKIPPKGESFSDFIATFTMSVGFDTYFDLQH